MIVKVYATHLRKISKDRGKLELQIGALVLASVAVGICFSVCMFTKY
jgi:uncharacterized membrane protein